LSERSFSAEPLPVSRAVVGLARVERNIREAVHTAMELADFRAFIPRGSDVAFKPNLGWDLHLPGAVSGPWVVAAVIEALRPWAGRLYLIESNQILVDVERALRQTGLDQVCRAYGVEWVNLSRRPWRVVETGDPLLPRIEVPEILSHATLVTLPVLKTHGRTVITGALKNQWGCLRELRHNYHLVVDEALAILNRVLRPAFAVMDGTIGLEGNGPKSGRPRVADLVLASGDLVALDTIAATVMGIAPDEVAHLATCAAAGLGVNRLAEIDVRGLPLAAAIQPFQRGRNNTVAVVEILLRRSALRRLVFETPLLRLMSLGAKAWYWGWYYLYRGRRYRQAILAHPYYGAQWRAPANLDYGAARAVATRAG
jgi:uncharacterized protein (DUF362 family)